MEQVHLCSFVPVLGEGTVILKTPVFWIHSNQQSQGFPSLSMTTLCKKERAQAEHRNSDNIWSKGPIFYLFLELFFHTPVEQLHTLIIQNPL